MSLRKMDHDKRGSVLCAIRQSLVASFCIAALSSCANLAGPEYERPEAPAKEAWSITGDGQVSTAETIRPDWWAGFGDPYLNELVKKAIAGNIDIKILAVRIDAAGAGVARRKADSLPKFNLDISRQSGLRDEGSEFGPGATQFERSEANVSGLSWEIDIWGKVEKGIRAEQAEFKASEADWRAGYLTLVADVATTYFQIRQLDEQIGQQQATLNKNLRILNILQAQQREGLVATTRVLQQQAELKDLNRQLLDFERQRAVEQNRLATLMGVAAGNIQVPAASLSDTVRVMEVPAGLPSDLLARRPDIIAAEYRVLKAHELVGQARLEKLPSFRLTGSGGFFNTALTGLLTGGWSAVLGAALSIPVFDRSLDANIKSNEIEAKISAEEYRRTVINSFEEVENALVNLANRKEQLRELEQQILNLNAVNNQIYAQLEAGIVSQLEVFESERTLLSAQQSLLQIRRQILQDTVTLYKALGGGWPREAVGLAAG